MKVDLLSLTSGAVVAALGVLVLVDSSSGVEISPGWSAVILTAALGVIVLISGLVGKAPDRDDGPSRHD